MLKDLQEVLAFDFDQGKQIQQVDQLNINNEDYIKILPQLPKEVKPQKLQKLSKSRKLNEELEKGFIYLNQEQITNLDAEIGQYLNEIQYQERQISIQNNKYTLTSPMSILDTPYPLNLTRQWWYFKERAHVRFCIMHSQLLWYLYSQFSLKSQQARILLDQIVAIQTQEYLNRWTGLIVDDGQVSWFETNEGSLIKAARINMTEQIKYNADQEESNYIFGVQENMWFTNSQVCCLYYEHRIYGVRKTLTIYVRLQGLCYYTTMKTEDILQQMFQYGISLQNSPSFDVVQSHEIICSLCGKVSPGIFLRPQMQIKSEINELKGNFTVMEPVIKFQLNIISKLLNNLKNFLNFNDLPNELNEYLETIIQLESTLPISIYKTDIDLNQLIPKWVRDNDI